MAQVTDSELKAAADLQQYLKNRDEIDFFSGEPLRALRTLAYFDNVDFQLCASLAFAEITERDVREADRDSLEPILFLLESPDIEVQHSACAALGNLAVDAKNGVSIVLLGGLAPLIRLMNSPNVEVQCNAIGCITNLAMHEDNKAKIAQSEAVGLLTRHAKSKDIRVQKNATGALLSMTYSEDNRRQLVNAGAIPVLVELLSSPDIDVQFYCTTALSNIAVDAVGRSELTQNEDRLVQSLVHLMDSTSPKIQCQAALAFRNLAAEENYQLEIVPAGGLPPLLRLLQSSSLPLLCSAVACIRNISIHPLNEFPIIDAGFLKPLVDLLGSTDNEEIQCHAISTLRNLAEDSDIKKLVFEAGVLEKCKLLGLEAPLSVQLEMAPLILKLALSDKLKSHLLSSGVFDVVIPLSNSESTDVQAGCALVLRELSSKVDDYSIFIQHWEQPNGGIHGYLRRFLANEDPSIQYFAIGSLLPLLESEDKRLISLIGKAEDIVQMIMTIAENDESDREFAALARRSLELLGPRLEEPPVEDFSSIGSFTSEKNLEPDEVLTRRLLKILAAKESFSIKHLELDEDEEDKVAAFARRFLRGARKFVSDDESEDEESEDEVATAVALAQRLLEKLDAEESKSDDESESGVGLAVTFARWLLEMVAAEESKSDDKSEEDEERKTVALARRLLEMVVAEEYFSSEPFTVADDKGIYGDCLQEFAGPRLTFAAIAQEILFEMVEDNWFYYVDHDLIRQFLQDPSVSAILPRLPSSSRLCRRCKNIRKLSIDFKIRHNVSKLTPETCEFCNILCAVLKSSSTGNEESIYVYRDGPSLKVSYSDHDPLDGRRVGFMLRICAKPGSTYAPEDISSGFPILPEMGSQLYFQLLRYWVTVCNTSHHCVPQSDSPLPTRVLDVGHGKLRLSYPYQKEGKYIALSHCWGDLKGSEKEKFCTYACNVRKKCIGIDYGSLPTSFQDAITTTRELGIQFLWIDSMCIIQRHEGCSKECDTFEDFETECKRMESYFGSAYCTIAATSAQDSNQGFLRPRSAGKCVTVPNASGPLYVCEAIDDFRRDVVEGALNQRGWVYQERALSRRTIHFTKTQTYWECGRGICCETLTKMHNDRASIFADANFPKSFLGNHETFRFLIVRIVFEEFSKLALSVSADRSRAILGLEERIAKALNTGAENGVFGCYLHRSLLWQRSGNTRMKRIGHPEAPKEPSWSWVAYEGEISYMVIPSGQVAWSNAVRSNIPNKLHDGASHLQQPDNASSTALEALARPFSLDEEAKQLLIFDKDDEPDIRNLRCIVMGRDEWIGRTDIGAHHGAKAEQGYYVLVVKPLSSKRDVYERVGVGRVQKRHILYNTRAVWVRIV